MEGAEEESADATPGTRRRESAVAFQLPEERVLGMSSFRHLWTAPGNGDLDKQDPPSEDPVPVVRKSRRLRTAEAVQRCASDDRAPKDWAGDSSNSPAPVTRKPRRIRTVERPRKSREPSTSSKAEDDTGDNLVPVLRSARRTRTHSPGRQTTILEPGQEAGHEEERTPILRKNRRHRTLSPGSRLGQEPAPRDVDEEERRSPGEADAPCEPEDPAASDVRESQFEGGRRRSPFLTGRDTGWVSPDAARKAVAAVDAEDHEEERAKSSRVRMPLKAVVDFAGVANAAASAARKARRRTTIARKETTATPADAEEERYLSFVTFGAAPPTVLILS
eukprot:s1508_g6.t1